MIAFIFALCLGMNQHWLNDTQQMLELLTPPCWYDWDHRQDYFVYEGYSPMIWKVTNKSLLEAGELVIKYPGRNWFVYNEPEGQDQANTSPKVAADWFDKAYSLIKTNDPTALIGCCGIMIRQSGIEWMDAFKPVNKPDFYHIHIYATNKKDWQSFVDYWHWWNKKNVPTYITETCGVNSNSQADLLNYVTHYEHQNIKQIYWFAAYNQDGWNCGLIEGNKLTNLGNIYKQNVILKLTPTVEPQTPTPTATNPQPTIQPTITLIPLNTPTPTIAPTVTPTVTPTTNEDDTTSIPETDEPIILIYQYFQPLAFK